MAQDDQKTKRQLIDELEELRRAVESADRQTGSDGKDKPDAQGTLACSLDNIQDGLVLLSMLGTIIDVNQAAADIFGGSKEELLGKHFTKIGIFSTKDIPDLLSRFKNLLSSGDRTRESTIQITNKLGRVVNLESSITVRRMVDGSIGIVAVVRDVTERKQMEEQVRFLSQVTEQVTDSIITTDLNFKITYANQAFQKLYGYSKEELIGQSPDILNASPTGPDMQSEIYRSISEGRVWKGEVPNRRKDGSVFPCEMVIYPIRDDTGHVVAYAGSQRNITGRKLAEEALRENEEKYRNLVETSQDLIWKCDAKGCFVYLNPAWGKTHGYRLDEMLGRPFTDFQTPEVAARDTREFGRHIAGGSITGYETTQITKSGETIHLVFNALPLYDADGEIIGTQGTANDITERKLAEDALRKSEERYRGVVEGTADLISRVEGDGTLTYVNHVSQRVFGVNQDQALGMNAFDFIHPDDREKTRKWFKECLSRQVRQASIENRIVNRETGAVADMAWTSSFHYGDDGQLQAVDGIARDITERKLAQQALQASEERFRTQMVQSPMVMEIYDLDGLQIEVNKAYEELWGFSADTTVNKFNVLKSKEVEDTGLMVFVKRAYAGEAVTLPEYQFDPTGATESGGAGRVRWLSTRIYPLRDSSGNVTNIVITHDDVTDRRQAEERLRESEVKFRRITERINDVIIAVDLKGDIFYVSPSVMRVFGFTPEDLVGKNITELIPKGEIPHAMETFRLSAAGSDVEGHYSQFIKKDGSCASIELSAVPIYENDKITGAQGVIRDVTETRRLQALESRAERLETAGTIAGQVAHDFNNLLGPMMAYPELIREGLPRNHPALAYLDDIETAAARIAEINQDLLAMGRRGHFNQAPLNLNTLVQHAVKELPRLPKTVVCQTDLAENLQNIMGGGAQIHRLIANIVTNAIDALHEIGRITIKTENFYVDEVSVAYGRVPKGEYVKLSVSDTGCGISQETVQKIFDPFFTTKTTDKIRGSGLGLSVVDAVVRDHGGYLDLTTKVGEGTSFFVYFPAIRDLLDDEQGDEAVGGNEGILVVDDDEVQREVSTKLLEKLGYRVTIAESGEKAIELLKTKSQDLLVLDMVMPPGIDGVETYRQALQIDGKQKAIIVSGFSETNSVIEAQALGAGAFVKKPLTKKALAVAVRTELDRKVTTSAP